jgi:putative flavoprotein involved in K+ transport
MTLLSPTRLSLLPGMRRRAGDPAYLRFGELIERFDEHRRARGIEVTTGAAVTAVERDGAGFVVRWPGGELTGDRVINATGIIGAPNLPADLVATGFRTMHSLEVRRHHLEAARRLLVVGAGPSATEVLEGWLAVRRPGDRAWISVRGKIRAYPHHILGIDLHYWVWLPEHLPPRLIGGQPPEPMTGRTVVKAIRRGTITRLGGVTRYAPDRVECGEVTVEPDLLVLATGFRYATDHLRATGVDLLGYRPGRTLASPYLRGIARDARELARR